MNSTTRTTLALAITALALAMASPAQATTYAEGQFTNEFNASAACFPALPFYDGSVRKRPLAVANEGAAASFVTCSYITAKEAWGPYGGIERFGIMAGRLVDSAGPASVTVQCMGVLGREGEGAIYLPKSVTLQRGERKPITWEHLSYGQQFPQGFPGPVNMSCNLPTGTMLNGGEVHWDYQDATS